MLHYAGQIPIEEIAASNQPAKRCATILSGNENKKHFFLNDNKINGLTLVDLAGNGTAKEQVGYGLGQMEGA